MDQNSVHSIFFLAEIFIGDNECEQSHSWKFGCVS